MKILVLNVFRIFAIIPPIIIVGLSVCGGIHGVTFIDTEVEPGIEAFLLTLGMFSIFFWRVWLICIGVIVFTTIYIKKLKDSNQ